VNSAPVPASAEIVDQAGTLTRLAPTDSDHQLVGMWIARSASAHTRRNYQRQADRFLAHVARPLAAVRLQDVQDYLVTLAEGAPATRASAIAALKSLFSFAQQTGYLHFNVCAVVKPPPVKNTLAERIMAEPDALRMLALEPKPRIARC
jgi:site-specific recombinase XerD